MVENKKRNEII